MACLPEDCQERQVVSYQNAATCFFLQRLTISLPNADCHVERDICEACCQTLRGPGEMNPVIASLLYDASQRILKSENHIDLKTRSQAKVLLECAIDQLSLIVREETERTFPVSHNLSKESSDADKFTWASAMLTAPRTNSRIETSLFSLRRAGFENIRVFAEPNTPIPTDVDSALVTRRSRRHGNMLNFYACLSTLLEETPGADAYAVFQDDIVAAIGLRQWCEEQFWPLGNGIVSLFTPKIHAMNTSGWRVISPGVQRVCGAQAIVFRKDILQLFLSDPHVLRELQLRSFSDDAVIGGWLQRTGQGIAYHTPSLVQHVGEISSIYSAVDGRNFADAVDDIKAIPTWRPAKHRRAAIGLVGWNTVTGLGTINRQLVRNLDIREWLCPQHPTLPRQKTVFRGHSPKLTFDTTPESIQRWLKSLDWLIFAEHPCIEQLPMLAAHAGLQVACVPMWEWLQPELPWLQFVDLMICPTRHAELMVSDWAERYGYGWKTVHFPWPVEVSKFPVRIRSSCQNFLFVNGWGGGRPNTLTGEPVRYSRKGLELIIEAADMAPDLQFTIRSLTPLPNPLPSNIQLASSCSSEFDLYKLGDVCVNPSHYEGLGLSLLECQAAGMPLITTDMAPMTEVNPWKRIPIDGTQIVDLNGRFFSSAKLRPDDLVNTLRPLLGLDISDASRQAREYIELHRNWDNVRDQLLQELVVN